MPVEKGLVCPHCHAVIGCRTETCPLCRAKITDPEILRALKRLPRAFPARGKAPTLATSLFEIVYVIVVLHVALVALIAELWLTHELRYFWFILGALFYLYFFIRGTVQDSGYFSQKVVAQALALTAISFTLPSVLRRPFFIYEYVLPSVYLVSMIMVGIYILTRYRTSRKHLTNLFSVALLGLLPFVVLMISSETPNLLLSIITASLGGIIILSTLIFAAKSSFTELRRIFDI